MADIVHKDRTIQSFSYQEGEQWRPLAMVFTRTETGVQVHSVSGEELYPTEAAHAAAQRLAEEWVDGEDAVEGSDVE